LVKVVTAANRDRFKPLLDSMFRDRKRVFVDKFKWNVPVVDEVLEKDQFDNDDAVYLIVADPETGLHMGSARMLPTTGPHLLKDVFPTLCEGEMPIGDDVWEVTRMCTSPDLKKDIDPRGVRRSITIAFVEFAILYGATRLTLLAHMEYLSRILALGWECRPLGIPKELNGQLMGAMEISITPATLQTVRMLFAGGVRTPLLELEGITRAA